MSNEQISVLFSRRAFKNKPTDIQVADEIYYMKKRGYSKVVHTSLLDIAQHIEAGYMIFPSGSACKPTENFWELQILLFDFDNTGPKNISKRRVITALQKIRLMPTFVYDTYSSTKDRNRFRLGFVLNNYIKDYNQAEALKTMFWDLLEPYGVDKQVKTTSGVIFGGYNCSLLNEHLYSIGYIKAVHARVIEKKRQLKKLEAESLLLPTAKGYAYALNLVDTQCYRQIISKSACVIRLMQKGAKPNALIFDDDIADIDLSILKAVYTLHCRNETVQMEGCAEYYKVSVAQIAKLLHKNLYANNAKTLKSTLAAYNRLIVDFGFDEYMSAFLNKMQGNEIMYNSMYFDWLKTKLFDSLDATIPKDFTHNYMLKATAFSGNMYGELIAEQVLQSLLRAGDEHKYNGISYSTIINRIPQFRRKLDSLKTVNEKNTYMKRAVDALKKIIDAKSGFHNRYETWRLDIPVPTTTKLHKKIMLVEDENWSSSVDSFLRDMIS